MVYSAKAIANAFLEVAKNNSTPLTPMKLQKLIYFAHGWNLALFESPLIDERVEAWKFGPVIPSIYHEFKRFGSGVITSKATDLDPFEEVLTETQVPSSADIKSLLEKVMEVYGDFSGVQLSNMTHEAGTPWAKVWNGGYVPANTDIDDAEIKRYFEAQAD